MAMVNEPTETAGQLLVKMLLLALITSVWDTNQPKILSSE